MKLNKSEKQLALKVSKKIQHFLEITNRTNLRSTDVFPYLQRQGLFKNDIENGKEFRSFLKKLYKCNMLKSLVPQCDYIPSLKNPNYGEWYFHDAKDKMPILKHTDPIKTTNNKQDIFHSDELKKSQSEMEITEAINIIKMLIAGINPITERPQDDLGVCSDITVIEALKTVIDPMSYEVEINKLESDVSEKYLSASALGQLKNKSYDEVLMTMKKNNLILGPHLIRKKGIEMGLMLKQNSTGKKWIVYPESLSELL